MQLLTISLTSRRANGRGEANAWNRTVVICSIRRHADAGPGPHLPGTARFVRLSHAAAALCRWADRDARSDYRRSDAVPWCRFATPGRWAALQVSLERIRLLFDPGCQ